MKDAIQKVLAFLEKCVDNPKTSATGFAMIAAGVVAIVHNPASLAVISPENPLVLILGGIGLVSAADQKGKSADAQ